MKSKIILSVVGILASGTAIAAEKTIHEIAKELSNPLAKIINLPLQQNWDYGAGADGNGQHYYLQIQPVLPVELNKDWMLLSRTILKLENEHNMGYNSATGLGDLSQTFWLAPNANWHGWRGGFGAVFYIPTATSPELGAKQWGIGPSGTLIRQTEDWTYGLLASQTWSIADVNGYADRPEMNVTFLQPFVAYHLPDAWTVTATSEYSYDWTAGEETFPVNLMVAKVVKIGKMPVSFSVGGRYYIDTPADGPEWGLRAMVTLVLPNFLEK